MGLTRNRPRRYVEVSKYYFWGLRVTRRFILIFSSFLAASAIAMPAAYATAYFGQLTAWENGVRVAEASGGSIYYESGGVTERIRFRDLQPDGDGTYGQADHQPWSLICPPNYPGCYYTWVGIQQDQTDRYSYAYGWRISYMHEESPDVERWRTRASVCVDQGFEPDACDRTSFLEP